MLQSKKILVAVTGSIAAYKAAHLVRLLVKSGAEVRVLMTPSATDFITPLTLSTLSKKEVLVEYFDKKNGNWNNHVELGLWADMLLIAPASANTLAKMANGSCDNLVLATYLSTKCPVFVAPAMDLDMYKHPATVANLKKITSYGNHIIPAEKGELASGLVGEGRMAEPENIISFLSEFIKKKSPLANKRILITAGPTYEAIDPVRFIGNRSSGKMGYALALEAAQLGAKVVLVSGPTHLKINHPNIKLIAVESAHEMYTACSKEFKNVDAAILSAAVADYKPTTIFSKKIKKGEQDLSKIELTETTDILAYLGKLKKKNQLLVGFALETHNKVENARKKIKKKNLDFIVLNSLNDKGAGFSTDTNKIAIITKQNKITRFELKSKTEVAKDILSTIFA